MAILTFSRQLGALGDEIASLSAKKLGYKFVNREAIEQRIVELGFPKEKLRKYDEKKPGFFASLHKDRDEYLDYLQTAVLEAACENNTVLTGRGAFVILADLPNQLAFRCVAPDTVRLPRIEEIFNLEYKPALKKMQTAAVNQAGFHKSFFNFDLSNTDLFHLVINSGLFSPETASDIVVDTVAHSITPELEASGQKRAEELLVGQRVVNMLIFDYELNISFLRAVIDDKKLILQGVADSSAVVERAVKIAGAELPKYTVESAISIVQDFKAYSQ